MSELPERKLTNRFLIRIDNEWDDDGNATGYEDIIFVPGKLLLAEAITIEKSNHFGLTVGEITGGLLRGSAVALSAAIWIMHKRSNPALKPTDEQFVSENVHVMNPDLLPEHGGIPFGEAAGDVPELEAEQETEAPKAPAAKRRTKQKAV